MIAPPKPTNNVVKKRTNPALIVFVSALILCFIGGLCVVFCFSNKEGHLQRDAKQTLRIPNSTSAITTPQTTKSSSKPEETLVPTRYESDVEVVSSIVTTNKSGAIIEQLVMSDGKRMKKVTPPKPVFDNPCDQVIALAVSVKPGESMPPLPDIRNLDNDFVQSLLSPIAINNDDPEDLKELKAKVMEVRAYLAEEVKNGGSVVDALLAHQAEIERIADRRLMAIQETQKILADGDTEIAVKFARQINESFRVQGIPEIPVPGETKRSEEE